MPETRARGKRAADPANKAELEALDEARDLAIAGCSLAGPGQTRFSDRGAHDPTPTPYFVLEQLFGAFDFSDDSHLLDVGCGTGRTLAYFVEAGFPGHATGVELDPQIAAYARAWAQRFDNLSVICADAREIPLDAYTHVYLFNPFDTNVLLAFLARLEAEAARALTLVHMSDNGETYYYIGRDGWSLIDQGEIHRFRTASGRAFPVYQHPQHYSVWRFEP